MKTINTRSQPRIQITLNGIPLAAMLDTGSSKSFISTDTFDKLLEKNKKLKIYNINQICSLANSHNVHIKQGVNVTIHFEQFSWKHEFWILDNLVTPVILGLDFMNKSGVQLNFDLSQIKVSFKPEFNFAIQDTLPLSFCHITQEQNFGQVLSHLHPEQRAKLLCVINQYPEVLTKTLGKTDKGICNLTLTDENPCRTGPYMLAPPKLALLRQHINQLLREGVIIPMTSDYSSPCFLIPKKDGSQRLVVDYRKVNSKIVFDTFPLPTIESALMTFGKAKFFTILDLNSAYHQVPLTKQSQRYTAFATPFGTFAYTRLPFGLTVGSQVLSRILNNLFSDISWKFLFLYLDDLLIFSDSFAEHLVHVAQVLERLKHAKFTVNPEKASFCVDEIQYLGYLISHTGVRVNPERVQPILDFPVPKTLRQLKRFLGMTGFYARFIANMSKLSEPLNTLKRKGVKFKWEQEHQMAFDALKQCLSSPPLLHSPDFAEPFTLQTDASEHALGAVLQQTVAGRLVPIAFASRLLTPSEIHTSVYEKECLAAVWACEKFAKYIEHSHFTLHTDNQALSWLKAQPHSLGKIGRWLYRLSAFSFTVKHIPAADNVVADSLSRLFDDPPIPQANVILVDFPLSFTTINQHQQEDTWCKNLIQQIESGVKVPNYAMVDNLLVFKTPKKNKKRVVIPQALRSMICKYHHSSILGGHLGVTKTILKISQHFSWPNMRADITQYVLACQECQFAKPAKHTRIGMQASQPSSKPWQNIHIDYVGPLTRSTAGNIGLLSIIDTFSKFVFLFPVKKINTESTINLLVRNIFSLFGPPQCIVTDNHSVFVAKAFNDMCFSWGIKHRCTSPYHPQASHVERFHRNLRSSLIIFSNDNQSSWDYYIPYIQTAFNGSWHSATKASPSLLFLGRELLHPLLLSWNINLDDDAYLLPNQMEQRWADALSALKEASMRGARYYDKLRIPSPFKIEDWVLLKTHPVSSSQNKFSAKLAPRFAGPYVICKMLTPVTVLLRLPMSDAPVRQAHVSQLKNYVMPQ